MSRPSRKWCSDCRRSSTVEDEFTAGDYSREGEREWMVTALACGHYIETPAKVIGPAPGAPYAGVPTVERARPRDLAGAPPSLQKEVEDPWST